MLLLLLGLNTCSVLMLVGACGVLCLRSAARRMMKVAALGWIVYCVIGLFFQAYIAFGSHSSWRGEGIVALIVVSVVWIGMMLIFPLLALRALNSRAARRALAVEPAGGPGWPTSDDSLPPSPAIKAAAILLLITAGFKGLSALVALFASLKSIPTGFEALRGTTSYAYYLNTPIPWVSPSKPVFVASAVLALALVTMVLIGGIRVLRGGLGGAKWVVIYATVSLVLAVSNWSQSWRPEQLIGSDDSTTSTINLWMAMVSSRISSLAWVGILLAVFGLTGGRGAGAAPWALPVPMARPANAPPEYSID